MPLLQAPREALCLSLAGSLLVACGGALSGSEAGAFPLEPDFLRLVEATEEAGERLETSILSYADASGREVDLVAVVHVGDRAYYEELNRRFASYDSVLYELIAERGQRPDPEGESDSLVSLFQGKLKDLLALEFQLDVVDYTPANLVHADVSPSELDALYADREDSLFASLFRAALKAGQSESAAQMNTFTLLRALFAEDRATELKRMLARVFEDIDLLVAGFEDESGSSVIVSERNKRAMEVLAEELEAGRERLAIFYGAAHMEDFHTRLVDLGFAGKREEWLTAWSITPPRSDEGL